MKWPIAPFPRYRYPLESNKEYNAQQDEHCIEEVSLNFTSRL